MKIITISILAIVSFASTYAQKLPNVQQENLLAPKNLKIDGKITEWGELKAYNKATGLYYTMANDDKNLYLAIQADDPDVLSKITQRGIVLEIDASGKRNSNSAVSIRYPVFDVRYKNKTFIKFSNAGGLTADQRREIMANPDSMLAVANRRIKTNDKYILTTGMDGVDTVLSIYNDKEIIARQGFDKWELYNCELAIPLKYLKLPSAGIQKFSYHVVLNGFDVLRENNIKVVMEGGRPTGITQLNGQMTLYKKESFPVITATTDFWGEYTLAK